MNQKEVKLCDICCSKFNKSTQKEIKCDMCGFTACLACTKQYILATNTDYHCMNCRNKWNRGVIVDKLPQAFIKGDLREHEEERIVNMEKARLPDAQTRAEHKIKQNKIHQLQLLQNTMGGIDDYKDNQYQQELINIIAKNYGIDFKNIDTPLAKENEEEKQVKRQYIRNCPNTECRGFINDKWTCGLCISKICKTCFEEVREDENHVCDLGIIESNKIIMKDTKPCPKCNSMIHKLSGCFAENSHIPLFNNKIKMSQHIKIGDSLIGDDGNKRTVLDLFTGIDNLYKINQSNGNAYIVNSKHDLVLKNINNNIFIYNVTDYINLNNIIKNKLYGFNKKNYLSEIIVEPIGIGKYYGWLLDGNHRFQLKDSTIVKNCDQMFCTVCQTAFSWNRGVIEKGPIHNPHYFAWKMQNNKTELQNTNGQLICNEDEYPNTQMLQLATINSTESIKKWVLNFLQYFLHIDNVVRPLYQPTADRDEKMDINIDYMMGKMSKTEWKKQLYSCDKRQEMATDIMDLINMTMAISGERFRKLIDEANKNKKKPDLQPILLEINNLIDYIENEVESIRKRFMVKNVIIPEQYWNGDRKKEFIKTIN